MTSIVAAGARPSRRPSTLGLLLDRLHSEYAETVLSGAVAAAQERGVRPVFFVGGELAPGDVGPARHAVFDLATPASVDALVLVPLGGQVGPDALATFCRRFAPLPICGIAVPWHEHPSVLVDNEGGFRRAIEHLIDVHGRRRVAYVSGPEHNAEARLRREVYARVLSDRRLALDPDLVAPGDFLHEGGARAVELLLDERRATFDALVCANDAMAIGALEELRRRRVPVPGEVPIVGFDDLRRSRHVDPALTTVRQPVREQARRAVEAALSRRSGDGPDARSGLPTELVVRESCGCPAYVHPSEPPATDVPVGDALEALRRSTADVTAAIGALRVAGTLDASWPERLCAAFVDQVAGADASFLGVLGHAMQTVASAEGEVALFQDVVTALVRASLRHLRGDHLSRADGLLHAARVKINGVVGRVPLRRRIAVEDSTRHLLEASRDLARTGDVAALARAMPHLLDSNGLSAACVCVYEGDRPGDWARLLVAHGAARAQAVPEGGLRFPAGELLPDGYLPREGTAPLVVCALDWGGGARGYVVLGGWVGQGFVYEGLAGEIGTTLGRLELVDRLVTEARAREAAEARRLKSEMQLAAEIQAGVLPRTFHVEGLDIAAVMRPATEVSGDYYDVVPTVDGCWMGIGDATGHGLTAGLVMLMVQSAVSATARRDPRAAPEEVLAVVNAVVYEHVRHRMRQSDAATLTLLRYERPGRLRCAGAHEPILVCRADDGRIDLVETLGTWVGLVPDVRGATTETAFELGPGDTMLLYTDGITEARNDRGEMFGVERLADALAQRRHDPVEQLRDGLLARIEAWSDKREDDMTLMVARQRPGT
ncbi:MAG TPA: SpoIIE family protein phosphatase [Polyangiaceae bacterium]|nr:SpoIIE family protein phosphatase [Polyangiaceae bacterium]